MFDLIDIEEALEVVTRAVIDCLESKEGASGVMLNFSDEFNGFYFLVDVGEEGLEVYLPAHECYCRLELDITAPLLDRDNQKALSKAANFIAKAFLFGMSRKSLH